MKKLILGIFVLALPSLGAGEMRASEPRAENAALETRVGGFRGKGGKGFSSHKRGRYEARRFRRDLPPYFYYRYRYPEYFRFYERRQPSYYPYQGGSDYREWNYQGWFDLPRR